MYYIDKEYPGVEDSWETPDEFIADMKTAHPGVIVTHISGDKYVMQSEKLEDLYKMILQGRGDDIESALEDVHDSVTYRS